MQRPPDPASPAGVASRWRCVRRWASLAGVLALIGLAATVAVAWVLAVSVELPGSAITSTTAQEGDARWTVTAARGFGSLALSSRRERGLPWDPSQAAGPPDVLAPGDNTAAWASAGQDDQAEWLMLTCPAAVRPVEVHVHESYCPGALVRVTAFTEAGEEVELWQGADPTPASQPGGVSKVPAKAGVLTRRLKIHLDSQRVPGWNEIDAVGIVDDAGKTHWASSVQASSTYASRGGGIAPAGRLSEMPAWCPAARPGPEFAAGMSKLELRTIQARGWPFLALWREVDAGQPISLGSAVVPFRPAWVGLLLDAAIYGLVAAGIYCLILLPRGFVVELQRMRGGRCLKCGYDLRYDFKTGCPECGWGREAEREGMTK